MKALALIRALARFIAPAMMIPLALYLTRGYPLAGLLAVVVGAQLSTDSHFKKRRSIYHYMLRIVSLFASLILFMFKTLMNESLAPYALAGVLIYLFLTLAWAWEEFGYLIFEPSL